MQCLHTPHAVPSHPACSAFTPRMQCLHTPLASTRSLAAKPSDGASRELPCSEQRLGRGRDGAVLGFKQGEEDPLFESKRSPFPSHAPKHTQFRGERCGGDSGGTNGGRPSPPPLPLTYSAAGLRGGAGVTTGKAAAVSPAASHSGSGESPASQTRGWRHCPPPE